MQEYVQKNNGSLPELIKNYYCELGKNLGLESKKNPKVLIEKEAIGEIDLVWLDNKQKTAGFNIEFGNINEFISACYKLKKFNAENSFLVFSGKTKTTPKSIAEKIFQEMFSSKKGVSALIGIHNENCFILEKEKI